MKDLKYKITIKLLTALLTVSVLTYSIEHYADYGIIPTWMGWASVFVLPVICLLFLRRFLFRDLIDQLLRKNLTLQDLEKLKKEKVDYEQISKLKSANRIVHSD